MNIPQIIVLLQLVLTLLSNPQTANNPQVRDLATQASNLATQALQVTVQDTSTNIPITPLPVQLPTSNGREEQTNPAGPDCADYHYETWKTGGITYPGWCVDWISGRGTKIGKDAPNQ